MQARPYLIVSAAIFALVFLLHLARLVRGADVQIGDYHMPMTASIGGLLVSAALSLWGFYLARR